VKQSSPNVTTPLSSTIGSVSGISNETELEEEKECIGKKWIVKVCLGSDIKIVGKAFVSSLTINVSLEQHENVNDEDIAKSKCIAMV